MNRLGTTTKIFIAMDFLMLTSDKNLQFRKDKSMRQEIFFPPHKNMGPETSGIFFESCLSQRYVQKHERNWNNSVLSRLTIFLNL